MRKIWHIAAAAAGTGLLALGGVITGAGMANASTNVHVTSCNDTASGLMIGVIPSCTSSGTVRYPTSIKLTVNSPELTSLLNPVLSGIGQGIKDDWRVACYAGATEILSESGTFEVTSSQTRTSRNLPLHYQTPSYCRVSTTVSTLLGASTALLGNLVSLGVSDNVTADTASTNAVRNVNRTWCADTKGDGDNPGNMIQVWHCISDPAQRWTYAPNRELVHEGRCLGYDGAGEAVLQACTGAPDQIWNSGGYDQELRSNGGRCLGVAEYHDGAQLHAYNCRWDNAQRWAVPPRASY